MAQYFHLGTGSCTDDNLRNGFRQPGFHTSHTLGTNPINLRGGALHINSIRLHGSESSERRGQAWQIHILIAPQILNEAKV